MKSFYTCFIYGEGGKERKFLITLIPLMAEHQAKKWAFTYGNASGGSPKTVLEKCSNAIFGIGYDLVMCFIDLDKLKHDHPIKWEEEKIKLEEKYSNFVIVWQIENLEDEQREVLGGRRDRKNKLNALAVKQIKKFKNSILWKRILSSIHDMEVELDAKKLRTGLKET